MKFDHYFRLSKCILWSLVLTGCIKEDLTICIPQTVSFNFIFVASEKCAMQEVSPEPINQLTVFVFDEGGRFVQRVDTVPKGDNYQLEILLIPARYQFVAVAGYEKEQLGETSFVPGLTRLEDAAVETYFEQRNGILLSAAQTLFLGNDSLTIIPETQGQEITIPLVQRTKRLNINVDGVATDRYQIALVDNAAYYTFDNKQVYLTGSPSIFVPIQKNGGMYFGTSLINWPLRHDGIYTRFQIIDPETGRRLVDEAVYELLQRVPGLDFDCADGFDIEIRYRASGKIVISIDGWKVYDDDYILM